MNTLALNSDYIIRTGAFDPKDATFEKREALDSKLLKVKVDGFKLGFNGLNCLYDYVRDFGQLVYVL